MATEHDIVLFFGDNLPDFTGFDEKSVQDRNQAVEEMHEVFGEKFIVFLNPIYINTTAKSQILKKTNFVKMHYYPIIRLQHMSNTYCLSREFP